ncbi:MAG: hypothetical protein AAF487_13110 [Bacteroidota bacterium]
METNAPLSGMEQLAVQFEKSIFNAFEKYNANCMSFEMHMRKAERTFNHLNHS